MNANSVDGHEYIRAATVPLLAALVLQQSKTITALKHPSVVQSIYNFGYFLSLLAIKMRSFVAYSLLASATFASALERRWDYPSAVPALERRQEPGTPRYACHEDCGMSTLDAFR